MQGVIFKRMPVHHHFSGDRFAVCTVIAGTDAWSFLRLIARGPGHMTAVPKIALVRIVDPFSGHRGRCGKVSLKSKIRIIFVEDAAARFGDFLSPNLQKFEFIFSANNRGHDLSLVRAVQNTVTSTKRNKAVRTTIRHLQLFWLTSDLMDMSHVD